MSLFDNILPAKELLSADDLIASGLFENVSQVLRAVDSGLPGIRLSFRSIKFARSALLEWLEQQQTSKKKSPRKKKEPQECAMACSSPF